MKKINLKAITIVAITGIFVICSFTYTTKEKNVGSSNGVTLTIATDNASYLESEPIWLIMDVIIDKNLKLDRKPVLYPESDLHLTLINSKGDTIKYVGGYVESIAIKEYPDTMLFIDNLFYFFGEPERFPGSLLVLQRYLPEEKYTLHAILQVSINNTYKIFQSNTVSFEVIKAAGEELKAYEKWIEIWHAIMKNPKDIDYTGALVYDFLLQYPNSRYFERARSLLLFGGGRIQGDRRTFITDVIKNNHNSGYNRYYLEMLEHIYIENNNKKGFVDFLNEMKIEIKGTLLQKIVNSRTREIELYGK